MNLGRIRKNLKFLGVKMRRLPVYLLLDTSGSMMGELIEAVKSRCWSEKVSGFNDLPPPPPEVNVVL